MKSFMIRLSLLSLILIVSILGITSQPLSDSIYHARLFYLCKVWGHAKYYHTRIAAGLVNWDNELLPVVTAARNAPTDAAFNEALLTMLNSCASGVTVVNIDNGFSAGFTASLINSRIENSK